MRSQRACIPNDHDARASHTIARGAARAMAHDERTHPSDDPERSVERAEEREDFDRFLSMLESLPSTDLTSDRWTIDLAEGREETPMFEPIAESSAKDLARAPDETRNVKRQRRAPAPAPPPPRAPPRGRAKSFQTVMLELRETFVAPALATLETFQTQGLFTDAVLLAETETS